MDRDHRHGGERLVHLEQIDVVAAPAGTVHRLAHREDRRGGEFGGIVCMGGMAYHACERRQAEPLGDAGAGHDQCSGAIGNRGGVSGGDRAVAREGGLQRRDLGDVALGGLFVERHRRRSLAPLHLHRDDLAVERAGGLRLLRAGERFDGVIVHRLARELIVGRRVLGKIAHQLAGLIGILKTVEVHVIVHRVVPDAGAGAVLFRKIRRVGHALHAARDQHIDRPGGERIRRQDRGLHTRPAHLVDRRRLDMRAEAGADRCLTRRGLAKAGGKDAAHVDALDRFRRGAGPLDRGLDRGRAEFGRGRAGESALERAHRGAGIAEDDDRIGGHGLSGVLGCQPSRMRGRAGQ